METFTVDTSDNSPETFDRLIELNHILLSIVINMANKVNKYSRLPLDTAVTFELCEDIDAYEFLIESAINTENNKIVARIKTNPITKEVSH